MNCTSRRAARGLVVVVAAGLLPATVAASAQSLEGSWTARLWRGDRAPDDGIQLMLELRRETGRGTSNWGFGIELDELVGLDVDQVRDSGGAIEFELAREAGTISFSGEFNDSRGRGSFRFDAEPQFVERMAALGYPNLDARQLFGFTVQNLTTATVEELRTLGYDDLEADDLMSFAIHGVTPEFITSMNELGYRDIRPQQLVQLRIHGVTPEFVRQVRAALRGGL